MNSQKIAYQSELHRTVLDAVRARWQFSREKFGQRHIQWARAEDQSLLYMPAKENDRLRAAQRSQGAPQFTTIEIPYSYAQFLAAHTYWTSVFLGRSPIHQFTARHGAAEDSVQAVEAIMDYQVGVGGSLFPYYVWLHDAGKYGLGVIGTYWDEELHTVSEIVEQQPTFLGMPVIGAKPKKVRRTAQIKGYVGNRNYNVRPYDFFPDPRVPISRFQDGEFCGRYVETGWNKIALKGEQQIYFNLDEAKKTRPSGWRKGEGSPRLALPNRSGGDSDPISYAAKDPLKALDFYELLEMYVELVPADWGLGSSRTPEKWCFTLCNDAVIIGCWPLGLHHNKYPFDILEFELEGYGLFKRGVLELLEPLNQTLTWLFNTHFHNVRKVINNQLVIDPSRITQRDITDPQGGRLIRLTPAAYGTAPRDALHQLAVADVTNQHISTDARVVMDMMNRVLGMNDGLMGVLAQGGRKSATEVRSANSYGVNRQKTITEYMSAQGWGPHATKMLQNTQQFYDGEQQFKIAGSLMSKAQTFAMVTPESIAGFYDFVAVDGTLPVDRQAQVMVWVELMKQMAAYPGMLLEYDVNSIFAHVAHLAGVKNLASFRIKSVDDGAIQLAAQRGDVVPIRPGSSIPGSGTGGPPLAPGA